MALTPEEHARKTIDEALHNAGWDVQDVSHVNVHAAQGVAIREWLMLDSRGVIDQVWRNRLFLQAFTGGARPMRHSWGKLFNIKRLNPLRGV